MARAVFSLIKFLARATDSIVTSLRDPAGLVAVGTGREVSVATPMLAWVGAELGISPAPQLDSNKLTRTAVHTMRINLIRLIFIVLLSPSWAYPTTTLVGR